MSGWIGVDFDGTLAEGHAFGPAVPQMVRRVKAWLSGGKEVRIVTARAVDPGDVKRIRLWLELNGLPGDLQITDRKDYQMVELWDDRAIQVERDTGRWIGDASTCTCESPRIAAPGLGRCICGRVLP